jgi:hypothetical protein
MALTVPLLGLPCPYRFKRIASQLVRKSINILVQNMLHTVLRWLPDLGLGGVARCLVINHIRDGFLLCLCRIESSPDPRPVLKLAISSDTR